ncbi:MAG: GPW/gp25 family protein [Pseudomonadota bacterium]
MEMRTKIISIHHPLAIDRGLGSVRVEIDYAEHVEQMIKQVLFTNPGERINRPDFGCGVRRMVFAPNNESAANLAQITVFQALDKWLGDLIKVEEVSVEAVNETLTIKIRYLLLVLKERKLLNLEVV